MKFDRSCNRQSRPTDGYGNDVFHSSPPQGRGRCAPDTRTDAERAAEDAANLRKGAEERAYHDRVKAMLAPDPATRISISYCSGTPFVAVIPPTGPRAHYRLDDDTPVFVGYY